MILRTLPAVLVALTNLTQGVRGEDLGRAPEPGLAARDLNTSFALPPLHDQPTDGPAAGLRGLQVGRRAQELRLDARSAQNAWTAAGGTLQAARARLDVRPPAGPHLFAGTRASELNVLLRDPAVRAVKVSSGTMEVDEPVRLRREGFWLDLGSAELRGAPGGGPRFLLRVEDTAGVMVNGGAFVGGEWGVLVDRSRDVTLRGGRYEGLQRGGVVLHDAPGAVLAHAVLARLGGAAVLVHGDTVGSVLTGNEITDNLGPSNWHAGIVLSDRDGPVADDPRSILNDDGYWAREQPIDSRRHPPRGNVVAFNRVSRNAASGIYCDGAIETVIFDNAVEGNSKEGICLDNGSTANVLAMNLVHLNGKRWGKTDAELKLDFVGGLARLPDGTSPAKTPGVSLDNALYNVVYANLIERNFGGGVKMVRTSYFNVVGLNVVVDNNEGASERFHFFGVELGAAQADVKALDLDFTPSQGNVVFGNTIRGPHYAGIFFGPGSTENDVFDNTIFGATAWAMEQVQTQRNPSLNNLTNLPSRNIDAGIDANLLKLTKGRSD